VNTAIAVLAAIDLPSRLELGGRILLAALLGGLVGLEREVNDHPAGLRTHVSVALGAVLFGIAGGYGFAGFDALRSETNFQVDPTRVASNIVTGVGFLGGGAILKYGATVRGLTTAASLWVTAAIGLGCALGSYFATLVTTGALLVALVGLRAPGRWATSRFGRERDSVLVHLSEGAEASDVISALCALEGVRLGSLKVGDSDGATVVRAQVRGKRGADLEALVAPLADRPDVSSLEVT